MGTESWKEGCCQREAGWSACFWLYLQFRPFQCILKSTPPQSTAGSALDENKITVVATQKRDWLRSENETLFYSNVFEPVHTESFVSQRFVPVPQVDLRAGHSTATLFSLQRTRNSWASCRGYKRGGSSLLSRYHNVYRAFENPTPVSLLSNKGGRSNLSVYCCTCRISSGSADCTRRL